MFLGPKYTKKTQRPQTVMEYPNWPVFDGVLMQFICFAAVCWQLRTFVPCKVWPKKIKSDLDWQCSVLTCWKIAAATASAPRSLGQFLQRPCKFGANKKIMFWVFVECIGNLALGSSKTASSQITQPCIYIYICIYNINTYINVHTSTYAYTSWYA